MKHSDEIDLFELASVIWSYKLYIAFFVIFVSVSTVIYVVMRDNIYESKSVLKPTEQTTGSSSVGGLGALAGIAGINLNSGGSVYADIVVLLSDQNFFANFLKKNNLAPKLAEDPVVLESPEFKKDEKFNLYKLISNDISVTEDKTTKYIFFSYRNQNPALAEEVLLLLLKEISDVLRVKQLENMDKRIENYKLEIDRAADTTLKTRLSELVASLIQSKVLANADEYYGFSIISAPSKPDLADKVAPKRAQICIIAFVASLLASIVGVIIYDTVRTALRKRNDADNEKE